MLDKIKSIINVKSIITLSLTAVFCVLAIQKMISQEFLTIYTVIISFYFGTQYQKNVENKSDE